MKVILAAAFVWLSLASMGMGKQYATADGHIVHTRRAPVVMHRVSPPFHGRHIYRAEGEAPLR